MFEIDKSHCNSIEQRLLYNIHELLREKNNTRNDQNKDTVCNLCGGVHLNQGERLACARKNKRKEV
jgi:hypothetical protein